MPRFQSLLVIIMTLFMSGLAMAEKFTEGTHYERINPPVGTNAPAGKVEVVEMFWYGCPHCFQFEPSLQKWLKSKPANVEFIRIPATFNPLWKLHARAFYTAEVLGVGEKIHKPLFDTYHIERNRLESQNALRDLFVKHGVKASDFDDTFNSFAVETRLARAIDLTQRYGISGVPSLIVNGKFRTSGKLHGHEQILAVLDYLIASESKKGK